MIRRLRSRKGQTLAEVSIAMLLVAIATASTFGVILNAKRGTKKADTKEQMAYYANFLQQELKAYVTARTDITEGAPGIPAWHLPQDESCTNCWALSPGVHKVSGMLPKNLSGPPVNGTLTYEVAIITINGQEMREVKIKMDWVEK
ncbi:MAG: type II secretion system protein [Elusimicrobia bacterium]|nr:type II secretion system protein [Elusimicrobiota bacterium]